MKRRVDGVAAAHHVAPYLRILVVLDGAERVASLLDCIAGWVAPGAQVHVVGLARGARTADADHQAARRFCNRITLAATLDAACAALASRGIEADRELLEPHAGDPACTEALALAIRRWGADLTICTPGNRVVIEDELHCPVLQVPAPYARRCAAPPPRIFVASDGSPASACAVREAARLAEPGATVRVAYLACDPVAAQHPEDFDAAVLKARHDGETTAQAIVEAATEWRADLLVCGTRAGQPGGRWRYGSAAADVAQMTVLPLLLVPQTSGQSRLA